MLPSLLAFALLLPAPQRSIDDDVFRQLDEILPTPNA